MVVTGGLGDDTLFVWNVADGQELRAIRLPHGQGGWGELAFSPDGRILAYSWRASGNQNGLMLTDLATGRELKRLETADDWIRSLAFSPDGKFLVSGMETGTALIWDISDAVAALNSGSSAEFVGI